MTLPVSEELSQIKAALSGLSLLRRPHKIRLTSKYLLPSAQHRLERDLTACGCGSGSSAAFAAILLLLVFGRGPLSWELCAIWVGSVVGATLMGKLVSLAFTYLRAQRQLLHLIDLYKTDERPL